MSVRIFQELEEDMSVSCDTIPEGAKPLTVDGEQLWVSPSRIVVLKDRADLKALDHLIVTDRIDLERVFLFIPEGTTPVRGLYLDALRQTGETHLLIPDFRKKCANLICLDDLGQGKKDTLCLSTNGVIHYKPENSGYHPIGRGNSVWTLSTQQ